MVVAGNAVANAAIDRSLVVAASTFPINYIHHDHGVAAMPLEHVGSLSVEEQLRFTVAAGAGGASALD